MNWNNDRAEASKEREELARQRARTSSWGHLAASRLTCTLQHAGHRVLDIGCSTGAYVAALRDRGFEAFGCDPLDAPTWAGSSPRVFARAELPHLPFQDKSFDTCLAFEVLEHLRDPEAALQELHRVSRRNVILSVPNCAQNPLFEAAGLTYHHWIDRTHRQYYDEETLRELLHRNGFVVRTVSLIHPTAPETLALAAWRVPAGIARFAGKLCRRLPFRRPDYMTILAVAEIE